MEHRDTESASPRLHRELVEQIEAAERELRQALRGVNILELCRRTGMTQQTLYSFRSGRKASPETLDRIARGLYAMWEGE